MTKGKEGYYPLVGPPMVYPPCWLRTIIEQLQNIMYILEMYIESMKFTLIHNNIHREQNPIHSSKVLVFINMKTLEIRKSV